MARPCKAHMRNSAFELDAACRSRRIARASGIRPSAVAASCCEAAHSCDPSVKILSSKLSARISPMRPRASIILWEACGPTTALSSGSTARGSFNIPKASAANSGARKAVESSASINAGTARWSPNSANSFDAPQASLSKDSAAFAMSRSFISTRASWAAGILPPPSPQLYSLSRGGRALTSLVLASARIISGLLAPRSRNLAASLSVLLHDIVEPATIIRAERAIT